jgi:O-antigen/teichoic acid export membrane protein
MATLMNDQGSKDLKGANDIKKRPRIHSVKFNVAMNMILTSSQFIFPLITVPYVSRVLMTHGTGAVAFAQSVVSYFSLIALLGIPVYGVKLCASIRDDREALSQAVQELMVILMLSTSMMYLIYIIAVFVIPELSSDKTLFFISSATIWLTSMGVEWFYQAIEQYGYITVRNIIFKLISVALMFLAVRSYQDYRLYALITVVANGGSNILNIFRLREFIDFSWSRKLRIRRHFKPMGSFMVMSVANGMFTQIDILLLGFIGTIPMVGLYQLVTKIETLAYSVVNSVSNVMLPRLSYYQGNNKIGEYTKLLAKNFSFLTMMSLAAVSTCLLAARPIVLILAGSTFLSATNALMIVSFSLVFSAYNTLLGQDLIASGRERLFSIVCIVGLIVATIYCLIFIPILGVSGAALSMTLCEATQTGMLLWISRKMIRKVSLHLELIKIVSSWILATACGWGITLLTTSYSSITQLVAPVVGFGIINLLLLIIGKEEFAVTLFQSVVSKCTFRKR